MWRSFAQEVKLDELFVDQIFAIAYLHQVLGFEDLIDLAATAAPTLDFFNFTFACRIRLTDDHLAECVNKGFLASGQHAVKSDLMISLAFYELL